MEKPKKERKFLKAIGKIAKTLGEELVLGIGRKFIGKVVDKVKIGKRERLSLLFLLSLSLSFASIDSIPYPITGNKQRLGFNTTGNGLVWRGLVSDTVTKPTSYADKNVKAYLVLDSVTGSIYVWKQGAWASLVDGGSFTQPVDSLFFKTSVPTNNVDTAKMRWDSDLGTVVLGMYDKVPNELGFKNFWLVKNQTGSTITKGSLVYASGTVGASGRISVSKFIANGTIDAKYLLGITAHDLTDGEDGYVISYGKIRQVNTDTFAAGSILYPSPTTAGVWTDVEPVAPNIDLPIGFCVNSSSNNGTIAIRVASGFSLSELHDVAISSPSANASLYYSGGLWRDTTAALLVSDTASMLTNYLRSGVAASTYLPLTGGTLTGNLVVNGTTRMVGNVAINTTTAYKPLEVYGNTNDFVSVGVRTLSPYQYTGIHFGYVESNIDYRKSAIVFQRNDTQLGAGDASGKVHILNMNVGNFGANATLADAKLTISNTGNVGINDTTPDSQLKVNGTFGVTGATTLSGALTVNNATVLNEGSGDYDTRIESDGNANMVFVDASTNRVGIGTATPSKTLDVVGTLGVSGVATFAGNTVIDGGLKAKILKESGTGGFFNQIPSDVVTYIFEYTGATTGGGSTDFLGSPSSHTNRIINIINVSDVDYYLGFMTNLPYIKTNTTISELDYGQSMTVQSDGSKWWVISRNF